MRTPTWISFGIVTRAHGVRGELRVVPHATDEPFPADASRVRLSSSKIGERELSVSGVRPVHQAWLITFDEISDRDAAQQLSGADLQIPTAVLAPPEPGEVYVYELEGATVMDEQGRTVGTVKRLVANRGQDLLEIHTDGGDRLLPYVSETIVEFVRTTKTLVIRPIPGLWE